MRPLRRLGRRPVLDGVRGVAVVLVILTHTAVLARGWIGVDVFFVLSGFLITTLLCEEWDDTGRISLRRFYERRARRLLPALFLLVAAFAALYLLLHPFTGWSLGERVLTTLLFVNNWMVTFGHTSDLGSLSPTWSLAMEDQFYLLWPLALLVMLRRNLRPGTILTLLAVAVVGLIATASPLEHVIPGYNLYFSPPDRAAELLAGCATAIVWRHRSLPRAVAWPPLGALLLAGFVLILIPAGPLGRLLSSVSDVWVYMAAAALGVLLLLHLLECESGPCARLIGCRPLRYLGRISYGLYLGNLLIRNLAVHYLPGQPIVVYLGLTLAGTVVVASASWHMLEAPVLARHGADQRARRGWNPAHPWLQPAR